MFLMKALLFIHLRYPHCVGVDLEYLFATVVASGCASGDPPFLTMYTSTRTSISCRKKTASVHEIQLSYTILTCTGTMNIKLEPVLFLVNMYLAM